MSRLTGAIDRAIEAIAAATQVLDRLQEGWNDRGAVIRRHPLDHCVQVIANRIGAGGKPAIGQLDAQPQRLARIGFVCASVQFAVGTLLHEYRQRVAGSPATTPEYRSQCVGEATAGYAGTADPSPCAVADAAGYG
ncbi:hypothetical protein D9M69_483920 [compost metagenome]